MCCCVCICACGHHCLYNDFDVIIMFIIIFYGYIFYCNVLSVWLKTKQQQKTASNIKMDHAQNTCFLKANLQDTQHQHFFYCDSCLYRENCLLVCLQKRNMQLCRNMLVPSLLIDGTRETIYHATVTCMFICNSKKTFSSYSPSWHVVSFFLLELAVCWGNSTFSEGKERNVT